MIELGSSVVFALVSATVALLGGVWLGRALSAAAFDQRLRAIETLHGNLALRMRDFDARVDELVQVCDDANRVSASAVDAMQTHCQGMRDALGVLSSLPKPPTDAQNGSPE